MISGFFKSPKENTKSDIFRQPDKMHVKKKNGFLK